MRKPLAVGLASLVLLLGLGLPTVTASESQAAPATKIKLSKNKLDTNYKDDSTTFKVKTDGGTWTATAADSWVQVTPTSGGDNTVVTVHVDANTVTDDATSVPRTSSVTFTSGLASATFAISQEAEPYINLSPGGTWSADWQGGSLVVTTDTRGTQPGSDCDFKVSADDWLSVGPYTYDAATGKGSFTVTAAQNLDKSRNGWVKITCGDAKGKLKVKQADGPYLDLLPRNWIVSNDGASTKIRVRSPLADWTAQVTAGSDWLAISDTQGTDGQWVTVTAQPNTAGGQRVGTIHFVNGWNQIDLTVTQSNAGLSPAVFDFGSITQLIRSIITTLAIINNSVSVSLT